LQEYIDRSVKHVLRTKFILGLFDNPYASVEEAKPVTRNEEAVQLAHQADLESVILLKNARLSGQANPVLPIQPGKVKSIALVGPVLGNETLKYFSEIADNRFSFISEKGYNLTDGVMTVAKLTPEAECKTGFRKS
jgi:beta-glucosidase